MEYRDYYTILGVKRDATAAEIKTAYRQLAQKHHPDRSKEKNAEERFKEIQEAYAVLKDANKRQAYDQLGSQWKNGQDFRPPPDWGNASGFDFRSAGFGEEGMGGGGFSDFFETIFGRMGGQAGGFGRQQRQARHSTRQKGRDEQTKIQISLEEAYRGGSKTIHLQVPATDSQGRTQYETRALKITIPAGILSGQQLRLAKQGSPGIGGGSAGDLYIEIQIQPHRLFTLEGHDVLLTLPITPWEAALGSKITVPTLGGSVEVKIAAGSQSGQKLRLKGRGLPSKSATGDQYVLLQIVTPPANTEPERDFYKKMAEVMAFDPRKIL